MPTISLRQQIGNSCAAHCTLIAAMELTGDKSCNADYAEKTIWDKIKFRVCGDPLIDGLAHLGNSDPRLIMAQIKSEWPNVNATILCDDAQKNRALSYVPSDAKVGLEELYQLIRNGNNSTVIIPQDNVYYNCTYLNLDGTKAAGAKYNGMHSMLVTQANGSIYCYNSDEITPKWIRDPDDWRTLENLNQGQPGNGPYSYVFTGVCVAMKR